MKLIKISIISVLVASLAGCMPHWTKAQCTSIDMHQKGLEDGRSGHDSSTFANYQNDCNSYKITLNRQRYMNGWKAGNGEYCETNNIYLVGKSGKPYPVVCRSSVPLRRAYDRGYKLHLKISSLESKIAAVNAQINQPQHLQAQYNQIMQKVAQDRMAISENSHWANDYQRGLYEKARAELDIDQRQANMIHDKIIATTAVNAANPKRRQNLIDQRDRLENQLMQVEQQG